MDKAKLKENIIRLKAERNAAILVHNYQRPEIQELADYLGDSLDLARRAQSLENPVIVFCGVHFMAESAAILAPDKTVLLPELDAGCPLADCATAQQVRDAKDAHPNAVFVAYINTTAAVKAEVDAVCTSANALQILSHYKDSEICYLPDKNLAAYAEGLLGIEIIKWPGQCYVHDKLIQADAVDERIQEYPDALVMAHPEAPMDVLELADVVTGTSGMIKKAKQSQSKEFIVVTEKGLVDRMNREMPEKKFIDIPHAICSQMKVTTLRSLSEALERMQNVITVPQAIAAKARRSLEKMLEFSK